MVRETSRYTTNHPSDVAARRMQNLQKQIKNGCTHSELRNPTERNVQKCMHEMRTTSKTGEQYKKDAKQLGERSDVNKHRRR